MTHLTTYQRLAFRHDVTLRLRKHASRKLGELETALYGHEAARVTTEGLMKHDDSNDGRGAAYAPISGAVTATTIRASDRQRIRDGHDARSAEDRATWRNVSSDNPYGDDWRAREDFPVGEGLSPADKCSPCVVLRVPRWAVDIDADERGKLATRIGERPALTLRDVRPAKRTARTAITASVKRAQRQSAARAAAAGDPHYRHDATQG
jgi:hypothetical protein